MTNDESKGALNLQKNISPGLEIIILDKKSYQEYFITAVPVGDESAELLFERAAKTVHEQKAQVISQEVFGVLNENDIIQTLRRTLGKYEGPVTWLENGRAQNLCGTHIWAISGITVEQVDFNGRIIGSIFEDDYARYCRLSGLLPRDASKPRTAQAAEIFKQMDTILRSNGMEFTDVLRTWFYNDNILDWYGEFNKVRNSFFNEKHVYERLVPASTGVGGRNPAGTALIGALLAVKAKSEEITASKVKSPLQSPALEYGSSFSRAVEISVPNHRRLFISGTASIDPNGATVHTGDAQAQVELTMKVVHAILESRDMSWFDVTRALTYFKYAKNAPIFNKYCKLNNVPQLPVVTVENDICREDLLFEIELDAIKAK
ncbi:MAG: hypothetical protein JW837_08065 [Sedimentisphaerales bacterium]|nr:hypothetical protein [Sedimentisphaerales bacterium]